MPYYRVDVGDQQSAWAHFNFGRQRGTPAPCVGPAFDYDEPKWFGGKCGRVSIALCDAVVGRDELGKNLTCDAPLCDKHRTSGGHGIDYCPRHKHLASAELPL